ncbi:branched-chain amino acid ABC transporter permease [Roseomonas chloroacetimidivorans]|jgi:branched-chain amino acid transport system permease protein|uniref:branched-chain amino acid ABC transporter permease n=1 Tax=Roseomonas chloroacetimidivorans TaxID=1766656 RepID=UPI003C73AFC5
MLLSDLLQFALNGVVTGCFYALTALGLSLVFGLMNIVNFAHGALFVLGGMLASVATERLGLPLWAAIPAVLVIMWGVGVAIEAGLLARMRDAHILPVTLVTIGLSVFLVNTMLMVFGTEPKNVQTGLEGPPIFLGDVIISQSRILAIGVSVVAIVATWLLISHTRAGRAMRAVFQQPEAAALAGIPIARVHRFTFALGTTLAGLAGILLGAVFVVDPSRAEPAAVKAFVVIILGGIGSLPGAVLGGILLGLAESLWGGFVSTGYMDAVGFVLVIAILLFRPSGLLGAPAAREG